MPRRAEMNSGYDNANVRTRMPRLGKGRRHAHLSAGMLVHSNQVGEGKEKLSKLSPQNKLARQTKLPRQAGRREDQAVGLGGVMFAELEAFAVEDGVPAVTAADGIEAAVQVPAAVGGGGQKVVLGVVRFEGLVTYAGQAAGV